MNKYSMLFYLNDELRLVQLKLDSNLDKISNSLSLKTNNGVEIIAELKSNPTLNLAGRLETFWAEHWANIQSAEEVIFWVGPRASFTDTRMLYLWLKTWADGIGITKNSNVKIPKLKIWNCGQIDQTKAFELRVLELLPRFEVEFRDTLIYSQEPRIGRKGE